MWDIDTDRWRSYGSKGQGGGERVNVRRGSALKVRRRGRGGAGRRTALMMKGGLGGSIVFGGQHHWHVLSSHIPYTPYPLLSSAGATSRKCGCTTSFESSGMTDSSSVLPISLPFAHNYPTWQGKAGQDGTGRDRTGQDGTRQCKVGRGEAWRGGALSSQSQTSHCPPTLAGGCPIYIPTDCRNPM
ncbi:hypothetical protein L208DRAFT_594025 [Tricholoma matsutake]|nr:hypothetical protein L208DRAFT_594025 [Tricholoma matsutake 945]